MDATKLCLAQTAAKYTQSTLSYISVVGLQQAIDNLLALGVKKIYDHASVLAHILISELKNRRWVSVHLTDSKNFSPSYYVIIFNKIRS